MPACLRTSSTFLDRLRSRDNPEAWERFVAIYGTLVRRCCQDHGLEPAFHADAIQETCFFVFQNIGRFEHRHPGAFSACLRVVVKNKIRLLTRRRKSWQTVDVAAMDPVDHRSVDSGQDGKMDSLVHRALELVRGEFKATTWQAFEKIYFQDGKPAAVARELGLSCTAVYIAHSRVRRRLAEAARDLAENEV